MQAIVELPPNMSVPVPFKRCAVVGSSKGLVGRRLGGAIEAHDTVIRVNRIPADPKWHRDFGNRSDVLFIHPRQDGQPMFGREGQMYVEFGGARKLCAWNSTDCPFKMVILKNHWKRYKGPKSSKLSWARATPLPDSLSFRLLRHFIGEKTSPTSGFEAFVTFGLLCKSMTLYGFSGQTSADGHTWHGAHKASTVVKEHALMPLIIAGKYADKLESTFLWHLKDRRGHQVRLVV